MNSYKLFDELENVMKSDEQFGELSDAEVVTEGTDEGSLKFIAAFFADETLGEAQSKTANNHLPSTPSVYLQHNTIEINPSTPQPLIFPYRSLSSRQAVNKLILEKEKSREAEELMHNPQNAFNAMHYNFKKRKKRDYTPEYKYEVVEKFLKLKSEHGDNLTLKMASELIGTASSNISKWYQQIKGKTISASHPISEQTCQDAYALFKNGETNIAKIAADLGCNYNTLYSWFKLQTKYPTIRGETAAKKYLKDFYKQDYDSLIQSTPISEMTPPNNEATLASTLATSSLAEKTSSIVSSAAILEEERPDDQVNTPAFSGSANPSPLITDSFVSSPYSYSIFQPASPFQSKVAIQETPPTLFSSSNLEMSTPESQVNTPEFSALPNNPTTEVLAPKFVGSLLPPHSIFKQAPPAETQPISTNLSALAANPLIANALKSLASRDLLDKKLKNKFGV